MGTLYLGIDVSKGYADMVCINDSGTRLQGGRRFDDTPAGHRDVAEWLVGLTVRHESLELMVGLESSGGLERNWLRFFKTLEVAYEKTVLRLNPLAVRRFLDQKLHRNVTDPISAMGIADYLRRGIRPQEAFYEPELQGALTLYRYVRSAIKRKTELTNELQSLLPSVHPDLVRYCRDGVPKWVLKLMSRYPTVEKLKRARPETLVKIPYVTLSRAKKLIAQARESVASQRDSQTGMAITFLCRELLQAKENTDQLKAQMCDALGDDAGVQFINSIKGIGLWGAVCLRLEIGSIERFRSPEALVAYSGLDPRIRQSGDGEQHIGISRRGRRQIRAILYPEVLAGIRCNPVIREFYNRLVEKGKGHFVAATACMRKLLHLIYGCWISETKFDPDYEKKRAKRPRGQNSGSNTNTRQNSNFLNEALQAPVSRREAAKRKKAATMPQTGWCRRERGPGAAAEDDTPNAGRKTM